MMRREYVRRQSRAARWAMPPSVFSPVLAGVAILAHRFGSLSEQNFILVLLAALGFAVAGGLLALLGLRSLWRDAAIGGRRSALSDIVKNGVFICPLLPEHFVDAGGFRQGQLHGPVAFR